MDEYDEAHQETGSSNISKATPEWSDVLRQARARGEGGYVLHTAYYIVNEQERQGIRWNKCPNCGSPYRRGRKGSNSTTCSIECWESYRAYINDPGGF